MSDKLVNKIIDRAVKPQLNKVGIDYIGVVDSIAQKTTIDGEGKVTFCNVTAFNERTGQYVLLPDVPSKINTACYKLFSDINVGDYVEIGFANGNLASPFIRRIISEKEIKDTSTQEQADLPI